MKNQKRYIKFGIFAILVLGILLLDRHFGWSAYLADPENLAFLKGLIEENYLLAVVLYITVTILGCAVLALPGVTFAVVSGMLFGPVMGSFACLIATTLGAMLAFIVGRYFLKDAVKPMLENSPQLKKLLFSGDGRRDIVLLMITRMVPIFPYNLQNFAYGITDMDFWLYSICTFVFLIPGVSFFTIAAAGLTVGEGKWKYFLAAGVLAILVTAIGRCIQKKFLGGKAEGEREGAEK